MKCVEEVTKNTSHYLQLRFTVNDCNKNHLCVQSADIEDSGSVHTEQVLTFTDSTHGIVDSVPTTVSSIALAGGTDNTTLTDFLSRPTLIDSRAWSTADLFGSLGASIEPWFLYLNNAVIKNKLQNYAFLRANLCVKFVINATPFHFGLLRTAYEPSVNAAGTGDRTTRIRTNPTTNTPLVIPYSQLPGSWLYPADNAGGEVSLPFFRYNNWLPLTSAAAAKTMGLITYLVVMPLQVASASGSTSVTIDTFAWLEDVVLSGATNELTLQAKDEYDGVISAPASKLASIAASFSQLPVIGRFARATEIGAGAVASIASIFGYTNVPNIDNVAAYVPTPTPHLASSSISTPIQKLTLDPKQELSIDPTMHGIGSDDEMAISNIVTRKSALSIIGWSSALPAGSVLFDCNVSPQLFTVVPILDGGSVNRSNRVYHTPMSYIGMMFEHWRGDIIFDIDVVCTKFHKGRLKICWDPLGTGGSVDLPENTVYTSILDIGATNKASIRIPYHQAYEWLRTRGIIRQNWSTGTTLAVDPVYDNGLFMISVLTPLMSPVTPQTVSMLISVRAADNFEFTNPSSSLGESSSSAIQPSFFAVQSLDTIDIEATQVVLGDEGSMHPHRYALNFGEQVLSLRTLLHRFSLYDISVETSNSATRASQWIKSFSRSPPSYGYDPNSLSSASKILAGVGNAPFNFTPMHPIAYVSNLYGAARGSVNYVVNLSQDITPYVGEVRVQRVTDNAYSAYRRGLTFSNSNTGTSYSTYQSFLTYGNGTAAFQTGGSAFTNTQTNGAIAWNQPQMSSTNFNYTDPKYALTGNVQDQTDKECSLLQVITKHTATLNTNDALSVTAYAGTGPDFTCLWFLCCPTLDYYVSLPTAT